MFFESTEAITLICFFIGLCVGSFLNVVTYRLPIMMEREWQEQCAPLDTTSPCKASPLNLLTPRSRCPDCGHQITAFENIPVISYLFLRGKCSGCNKPISLRYPLVEIFTAFISASVAWRFGFEWTTLYALILVWSLITLALIDFDTQLLPDSITLPLLWLGIAINLNGTIIELTSAVIGAMLGYLTLWSVFWAFKLATGKEGMGYGDFKLLAALGAWMGWQILPLVILLSSIVGAIVGVALILFARHGRNNPIPFGPYLAAAGVIALFWGKELTHAYLNLLA